MIKDALFLEQIQNVLDNYETSDSFMVFRNQIVVACRNASRSLKKKINTEDNES